VTAYQNQILQVDTAGSFASRMTSAGGHKKIRVVEGFYLTEWDPAQDLWGMSLKEARLPARYGIHVVLVKSRRAAEGQEKVLPIVPGPNYVIAEDDALIVYGTEEQIDRVLKL